MEAALRRESVALSFTYPRRVGQTPANYRLPDNVGRAWTTEEESRLVAAFKKGDSPVALAHEHGRTLRAVEARLEKLGLITAEQRTTRGGFTGQV